MLVFKLIGIILTVITCVMAGFLKSAAVKSRCKKLEDFCDGIDMLYRYIEQGGCEVNSAIKNSFYKCDFLTFKSGLDFCQDLDLRQEKEEINSFFMGLGTHTKKVECERICKYGIKFKKYYCDAQKEMTQKCKIYQCFGVCVGLAIGILLI